MACILKDSQVWDEILPKLDLFYVKVILPQILCPNATSIVDETSCSSTQQSSDQVEQLYCICRNVEEGLMIGCDNNDCPYECFHVGCVGLDCILQGGWYCVQIVSIKPIKSYQVIEAKCRKNCSACRGACRYNTLSYVTQNNIGITDMLFRYKTCW